MKVDLRFAALDDRAEQRVRIAARLLAAHGREARVAPWDGTRCDAVVVAADDGYGQHVLEIARRRGVAVVAMTSRRLQAADGIVAADGSAVNLAAALQQALCAVRPAVVPDRSAEVRTVARDRTHGVPGLVLLAGEPLRGADVSACVGGRTIALNGATGRASGDSLSDLLAARDHLGDADWQIRVLPVDQRSPPCDASMSLDAFFLTGALRAKHALPPFVAGTFALREWPDLGAAADALAGLCVAKLLLRSPMTAPTLAQAADLAADDVNACLWAFRASNLIVETEPAHGPSTLATPSPARPLFARLAARFGLLTR